MYVHPPFTKLFTTSLDGDKEKFQILNKTVAFKGLKIITTR